MKKNDPVSAETFSKNGSKNTISNGCKVVSSLGYPFTIKAELKYDLRKTQKYITKAKESKSVNDFDDARAFSELFILTSAFLVRKLTDAGQISNTIAEMEIDILKFKSSKKNKVIKLEQQNQVFDFYDFKSPKEAKSTLRRICNIVVHSFISMDCTQGENPFELTGFLINDEESREKEICYIDFKNYFSAVELVTNDGFNKPFDFNI